MKKTIIPENNNTVIDQEVIVLNNINSNKKKAASFPALFYPKPFIFSKPGNIQLYKINNLCMGIVK